VNVPEPERLGVGIPHLLAHLPPAEQLLPLERRNRTPLTGGQGPSQLPELEYLGREVLVRRLRWGPEGPDDVAAAPADHCCNRIEIASDRPGGIGLDVLRKVGVRGLMTTALSDVLHDTLHAVQVRPDGTMALEKVSGRGAELSEEIQATVQQLVGWVRA
jgi:hypothetical protein